MNLSRQASGCVGLRSRILVGYVDVYKCFWVFWNLLGDNDNSLSLGVFDLIPFGISVTVWCKVNSTTCNT